MEATPDMLRRLDALENIVVPRRETELIAKRLEEQVESTEEALNQRLSRLEDSMKWAFRMVAAAFIGFLFQGVIVLGTLVARSHG
jgi:hypothetical protein